MYLCVQIKKEGVQMREYYYLVDGDRVGPVTLSELRLLSCLTRETFVWHVDLANWVRADELEELSDLFARQYYYSDGEVQKGPVPLSELRELPCLEMDTFVWHVGLSEWICADKLPELSELFAAKHNTTRQLSNREQKLLEHLEAHITKLSDLITEAKGKKYFSVDFFYQTFEIVGRVEGVLHQFEIEQIKQFEKHYKKRTASPSVNKPDAIDKVV
jgi:hypothetical protein